MKIENHFHFQVNRASALRAYAVRQRMDYGSSYAEDAYLPKRFRRSRAMNYSRLSNSIDSSGYGTRFSKFIERIMEENLFFSILDPIKERINFPAGRRQTDGLVAPECRTLAFPLFILFRSEAMKKFSKWARQNGRINRFNRKLAP